MMKYFSRAFLFIILLSFAAIGFSVVPARQQQNIAITTSEGGAMKTIRRLFSDEATFQSTVGKGEYGDLKQLHDAGLIDKELAAGVKGGYRFSIVVKKSTLTSAAAIDIVARPTKYGKDSRRSFYMTESGILLTSEEKDAALTSMKPFADGTLGAATSTSTAAGEWVDPETVNAEGGESYEIAANEKAVIVSLRAIHIAQLEYRKKTPAAFGTLDQLEKASLIDKARAAVEQLGYRFEVAVRAVNTESQAAYSIHAVPQTYGITGRRSFFIDQTGVLRGADNEGGSSSPSDPAIEK